MKLHTILAVFTTVVRASAPPTCQGSPPSYCQNISEQEADQCRLRIAWDGIRIATCQDLATTTVTSTRFKCAATHVTTKTLAPAASTKKVYTTITVTGEPTTLPVVTVTATSTQVDTTIVTDRATITKVGTITNTQTDFVTDINTEYITSTSTRTIPFNNAKTCTLKKRVITMALQDPLPSTCSCFLTSTAFLATQISTVTRRKPATTLTTYATEGPQPTITQHITVTHYAAGSVVTPLETTKSITQTLVQTDHTLLVATADETVTVSATATYTDVEVETQTQSAVATTTADPCDDLSSIFSTRQSVTGNNIQWAGSSGVGQTDVAAKLCCETCFLRTDCVLFVVGDGLCTIYQTSPGLISGCSSPLCPRGFPDLALGSSAGTSVTYKGPCAGLLQA